MKSWTAAAACLMSLLAATGAAQQPVTGGIEVTATDPFDTPIADAEVTATSISGYEDARQTGPGGRTGFENLISGPYTLTVARAGFVTAQEQVDVPGDGTARVLAVLLPSVPAGFTVTAVDPQGLSLPGAGVEATGPAGELHLAATDNTGRATLENVRPGDWNLRVSMPGFREHELPVALDYGRRPDLEVRLDLASFGDTVVVTASRSRATIVDAPVTTSVVSQDAVATSAAGNVGEMLRSLPGMNVVQLSARDMALTSRGATSPAANSQLVLVDGRSIYLDFFGAVLWDSITINQADIEQIEVVRGPASATWGANAMTGAVNIITRDPRESPGTKVSLWGGWHDRDAGSTEGAGMGRIFGSNVSVTRTPSDELAYRISAGHYRADEHARPVGRIPLIDDPRIGGRDRNAGTVGGALHHGIPNQGTNQLKFDTRVDRSFESGRSRLSYSGGVATTEGIAQTGLGPFSLQRGGHLAYSKLNWDRDRLSVQFFSNYINGDAPSLLLPDANLGVNSKTFDTEVVHRSTVGGLHRLTYGGNLRHARFDIGLAPTAENRLEAGAFVQDEIDTDRFKAVAGARIDKFGNIRRPFVAPRLALGYKVTPTHVVTGSLNRAFRAPSAIEVFLEQGFVAGVDLSALQAIHPLLPSFVPAGLPPAQRQAAIEQLQGQLHRTTSRPFPLTTRAVGG
ncbi:MAG: TonB-dependent receptor, partial [Acidimicrobiaceae bacterium]|nr:TonB-dependent receptor [Acidimicrobiaceae bacterium]